MQSESVEQRWIATASDAETQPGGPSHDADAPAATWQSPVEVAVGTQTHAQNRDSDWRHSSTAAAIYQPLRYRAAAYLQKVARRLGYHVTINRLPGQGSAHLDPDWLLETHHANYGRPWAIGRDQLAFLVERGVRQHHHVLDFGCGAGRTGIWLCQYLNEACYHGIDCHWPSLQAFARYELPLNGLVHKHPRLLFSTQAEAGQFETAFDIIVAFSVLNQMTPTDLRQTLERLTQSMAPSGRLIITHRMDIPEDELKTRFGLERRFQTRWHSASTGTAVSWHEYGRG